MAKPINNKDLFSQQINQLNLNFTYQREHTDSWKIHDFKHHHYGDCEEYSLGLIRLLEGSTFKTILALMTGKYELHSCTLAHNNESHVVMYYPEEDVFIDNVYKKWISPEQAFQFGYRDMDRLDRFTIMSEIIVGMIF